MQSRDAEMNILILDALVVVVPSSAETLCLVSNSTRSQTDLSENEFV